MELMANIDLCPNGTYAQTGILTSWWLWLNWGYHPTCFTEQLAFVQYGSLSKSNLCPTRCFAQYVASDYHGFLSKWESSRLQSRWQPVAFTQYGALWNKGLLFNMGLCPNETCAQNGDSVQSGIMTRMWFLPNQELSHNTGLYGTGVFCSFWVVIQMGLLLNMGLLPNQAFCPAGDFHPTKDVHPPWGIMQLVASVCHVSLLKWGLYPTLPSQRFCQTAFYPAEGFNMKLLSNQGLDKRICNAKPTWWENFLHNFKLSCFFSSFVLCCCQDETAGDTQRERDSQSYCEQSIDSIVRIRAQKVRGAGENNKMPSYTWKALIWHISVSQGPQTVLSHTHTPILSFKDWQKIH